MGCGMKRTNMKAKANRTSETTRGLTFVELMVVMFIALLLMAMAVPVFSKFARTSKVDQAVRSVMTGLYHARAEAMRNRAPVVLFYGDDPAQMNPAPTPGVLPKPGQMELWTVRYTKYPWLDTGGQTLPYYPPNPSYSVVESIDWYPYNMPVTPLGGHSWTLPEGIRVVTGEMVWIYDPKLAWVRSNFAVWAFKKDPVGEIKRHYSAYNEEGILTRSYSCVLIYEEATGDHAVIESCFVGSGGYQVTGSRPRICRYPLIYVNGVTVTDFRDIGKIIRNMPGDR